VDRVEQLHPEKKPAPGWACIALGLGYIVLLGLCLIAVRLLAVKT
jgi:hypothetical protein